MAGQFSYKNFLRHIPNDLLGKYLSLKSIYGEVKLERQGEIFQQLKSPQIKPINDVIELAKALAREMQNQNNSN
jgi:hypothetical protein